MIFNQDYFYYVLLTQDDRQECLSYQKRDCPQSNNKRRLSLLLNDYYYLELL